ncbi:anthranilate phosphoribosyltransferase family protein [Microcoleus sp. FACHB-672]|uniref:anthranilate phosphoribosyltransferase family protein n=1 Tax=Microcoleus sp. FACHB-672 TaxID=2692825 RepID=UPI0016858126|nr:anthranilate phosphoribosyltransferase family protein [Microcoleus sp. FACHB-672]MBD2043451.1 anthranilate phosphoribosyltransferase family protein [Microcoleus sp. FACHB-672]
MSNAFRELLRKVGSGNHTGKNLSREEAAAATRMMLLEEATPAQIGAFLIAHRIKRPTGEELAGMLDAYSELGQTLQPAGFSRPVTVLGSPYDGHDRYAPVTPITALILAAAGVPVVLHGGDRMPTKEGVPLIEIWQGLGVNWDRLDIGQTQHVFEKTLLGFVYLPNHFPHAYQMVPYRSQIGKRPPFSTLELIWCPYAGDAHIIAGFVHPPTEGMFQDALALRGIQRFTTVKGLEGSCNLSRDRTAIIGIQEPDVPFERILLPPRDYGFDGSDLPFESNAQLVEQMQAVLQGKPSELMQSAIWNGGFYLWRCGVCADMPAGIAQAEAMLTKGAVAEKLAEISKAVSSVQLTPQV